MDQPQNVSGEDNEKRLEQLREVRHDHTLVSLTYADYG
jgi:hypothetical protein